MKSRLISALLTVGIASGSSVLMAQGASQNAPGKQKMDGQSAKPYAPGQQKEKGKSGGSAKEFAPGQQSKDGDRPMLDRMQNGSKGTGNMPGKGKN